MVNQAKVHLLSHGLLFSTLFGTSIDILPLLRQIERWYIMSEKRQVIPIYDHPSRSGAGSATLLSRYYTIDSLERMI